MTEHRASCQCGALRVVASQDPDFTIACSCKQCQRRTGSPFGVSVYFPQACVQVSGAYKSASRKGESGGDLTTHFCPTCGTNLWWRLDILAGRTGIAFGCFDTKPPEPTIALWTSKKHDWVNFPDHWRSGGRNELEKRKRES